jgi:D-alanine-D-alanine ligase
MDPASSKKKYYVLEINTIPGFTSTSLLPKAALQHGISFDQLCFKLLEMAYGKKKEIKDTTLR